MNWWIVASILLVAYAIVLALGEVTGAFARFGVTAYGPIILWRTRRGTAALTRLAQRARAWYAFAAVGAALSVAMMVILTLFLFWVSYSDPALPRAEAASEEVGPGIPGSSLDLALAYGALGIVVAVIVHELGHGVVAAAYRLRLDSVGVIFLAIPIGAFVEPNDHDLLDSNPLTRMKVYSAGAAANMAAALICVALLSWVVVPAADPVEDGVLVTAVAPDSPAELFGISVWSEVVGVGGSTFVNASSFYEHRFDEPGGVIGVTVRYGDERRAVVLPQGIVVTDVLDGPAENAGLKPGMVITSLNDTVIRSEAELRSVIENSTHKAPVNITVLVPGEDPALGEWFVRDETVVTVNLTSKWLWYYTHYNYLNEEEYKNVSYMGIGVSPFGLTVVEAEHLTDLYAHPYANVGTGGGAVDSTVRLLALPFIGYSPVLPPATDLYDTGVVPDGAFWTMVNVLYWVFWGNVMLGFANAMPALPFDGGYMFRDMLRWLFAYPRSRLKGIEKVTHQRKLTDPGEAAMVRTLTWTMTVATLVLVAWLLLDPWI